MNGANSLEGQAALVTGASSGIGRAIALALASLRVSVTLVGRNGDALQCVAAQAGGQGSTAICVPADLERDDDIHRIAEQVTGDGRTLDLLVHSAGAHIPGRWADSDVDDLDRQYRVNVRAPFLLTRLLLPALLDARGQVVFVNSSAGVSAPPGVGQYAATKHALKALADSLRAEVNPLGVRVLSVFPGRTAGPMQAALFQREGRDYTPERLLQPEDIAAAVVNALTLPRTAEVTDLFIRPFIKT